MCGRFYQDLLEPDLQEYFDTKVTSYVSEAARAPRYNIGPGQDIWVVRLDKEHRQRSLDTLHWGLIPHFAKDKKGAYRMINARAETVDSAPSYRTAFAKRRCLVVARGFYEWRKLDPKHKQPYAIAKPDRSPLALAGIWENWLDKSTGEWLRSVAIVTTEANDTLRALHERMPVVLEQHDFATWLGEEAAPPAELKALLRPSPEPFDVWPVDPRMNRVQVDDPQILEPIALEAEKRA
jgi:putative SOS response-associated peptidase YedK